MGINDLQVYQLAMVMGEQVWAAVAKWDLFARNTVGKQVVRSADSVAANLSEGFGRYHFKENIHFCYIARGSLLETRTWLDKARRRQLITEEVYTQFDRDINVLGVKLNNYLKALGKKTIAAQNMVGEPESSYQANRISIKWDDNALNTTDDGK
jgi:four helix bundle protein